MPEIFTSRRDIIHPYRASEAFVARRRISGKRVTQSAAKSSDTFCFQLPAAREQAPDYCAVEAPPLSSRDFLQADL